MIAPSVIKVSASWPWYPWPGNFRELEQCVRNVMIRKEYQPAYTAEPEPAEPPLFAQVPEDDLPGYGVPAEWLDDVRRATEESLFAIAEHLPHDRHYGPSQ